MDDNELIQWYKRVFDEYPSVGLLAFIREVMEQTAPGSAMEAVLREQLAEYSHKAWSGWMKYMFEKGSLAHGHKEGGGLADTETIWIMPAWAVERWQRQMNTPYEDLPESEKESDREEADKMLAIMRLALEQAAPALIPVYAEHAEKPVAYVADEQPAPAPNANELLPCPHCGETNIDATSYTDSSEYWMIYCPSCRILMDVANRTKDEAFALWNKRVAVPVSAWEVCEGYESMSKNAPLYLSPSQCRMLAEEGWRLVRPTTATSESQESVFSRAASSIALAALREAHERGETISIPSLGIEIPPLQRPATAAGEEE